MTSYDGAQAKQIKTIKFHGDEVANVVIFLRSEKDADIETFDAAGNPLVCETINIQVVADFVTIAFYKDEQAKSIIRRELIPSHRIVRILIEDLKS